MVREPHEILEIQPGAGRAEIERAVETLKRRFHPELNPGDEEACRRYREVLAAHAALTGAKEPEPPTEGPAREAGGKPQDTYLTIALTFREAALGTTRRVSFPVERKCRECGGGGCPACGRTGFDRDEVRMSVQIPPGTAPGGELRIPCGDLAGELVLIPRVADDPLFERLGDNVHCKVNVTVPEAALGTRLTVPTIDGETSLKIPPGTQSGTRLRLRGNGVPSRLGAGRGDMYVEVRVVTPSVRDMRVRDACRRLGEILDAAGELPNRGFEAAR